MKLKFQTKQESKAESRKEFLLLSPVERFNRFLKLIKFSNEFYGQRSEYSENEFILKRKDSFND